MARGFRYVEMIESKRNDIIKQRLSAWRAGSPSARPKNGNGLPNPTAGDVLPPGSAEPTVHVR